MPSKQHSPKGILKQQNSRPSNYSYAGSRTPPPYGIEVIDRSSKAEIEAPIQLNSNHASLPDQLKTGIEHLSGYSMDDVRVHVNSSKPAQLNAHAYAQGSDIHLGPGQEQHLPHEAWHLIQQKQGRVKPTIQTKSGVTINDDRGLEREADMMGNKANNGNWGNTSKSALQHKIARNSPIQRSFQIRKTYTSEDELPNNLLEKIKSHPKVGDDSFAKKVFGEIKEWANAPGFKGKFIFWNKLFNEVIDSLPDSMELEEDSKETMTPKKLLENYSDNDISDVSDQEIFDLKGDMSDDFNKEMDSKLGKSAKKLRKSTVRIKLKGTDYRGTTSGRGRFITMTGQKVLGDTQYKVFLKKLPELTGLTEKQVSKALWYGIFDGEKFKEFIDKLEKKSRTALYQTVFLFHNEIIHRSTTNLLSIAGNLARSMNSSSTFHTKSMNESLYIPTKGNTKSKVGGQQFSAIGHTSSAYKTHKTREDLISYLKKKGDSDLNLIWETHKKSIKSLVLKNGFGSFDDLRDKISTVLTKAYLHNLRNHFTLSVKEKGTGGDYKDLY